LCVVLKGVFTCETAVSVPAMRLSEPKMRLSG